LISRKIPFYFKDLAYISHKYIEDHHKKQFTQKKNKELNPISSLLPHDQPNTVAPTPFAATFCHHQLLDSATISHPLAIPSPPHPWLHPSLKHQNVQP